MSASARPWIFRAVRASLPALLLGTAVPTAADDPAAAADPAVPSSGRPTVELESGFFSRPAPGPRQVLTSLLHLSADETQGDMYFGLSFGWMALIEHGGDADERSTLTGPGNLVAWGRYLLQLGSFTGELGGGLAIGTTLTAASAERRTARSAYSHAVAMRGAWDAWLWAPDRGGMFLPVQLGRDHALGARPARLDLELAVAMMLPHTEFNQARLSFLLQAGPRYEVQLTRWLAVGTQGRFVWMPNARLFRTQGSLVPYLGLRRGAWRAAVEAVLNVDEPYGLGVDGQRIWAAQLKLGWRQ